MTPIISFLKSDLFKYLVIAAVIAGVVYAIYAKGAHDVQVKWDLEEAKTARIIAELKEKQAEKTTEVVIKYVDRVKVVTTKGDTIIEYVDRWITPEDNAKCKLTPSFILLHNSGATNTVPELTGKVDDRTAANPANSTN